MSQVLLSCGQRRALPQRCPTSLITVTVVEPRLCGGGIGDKLGVGLKIDHQLLGSFLTLTFSGAVHQCLFELLPG